MEIGTHSGKNAQRLSETCKFYYGFDLWEEAKSYEHNGKGVADMNLAKSRIKCPHELIKGDTRVTLPEFLKRGVKVDFAFIDGGHSVETIQSDWDCVKQMLNPGAIVVFDDYYDPPKKYGANEVVKNIPHKILDGDSGINLVLYRHP